MRKLVTLAVLGLVLAACSNAATTATGSNSGSTPSSAASTPTNNGNPYGYATPSNSTAAPATASTSCATAAGSGATMKGTKSVGGSSVTMEADNDGGKFYFNPTCLKGSGTVMITIKDVGSLPHNFSITSLGINKDLTPGKSVTVSVKFPASGSLQFFCEYHHSYGMKGALISG